MDLQQIAMASDAVIYLRRDNASVPEPMPHPPPLGWLEKYKKEVLALPVYRGSTYDRRATLRFRVDADLLAPQHLLMHDPGGGAVYYEVNMPFIHRIGVPPGGHAPFAPGRDGVHGVFVGPP